MNQLYLAEKQNIFVCDLMSRVCASIRLCACVYPWCFGGLLVIIRRKRLCDCILPVKAGREGGEGGDQRLSDPPCEILLQQQTGF